MLHHAPVVRRLSTVIERRTRRGTMSPQIAAALQAIHDEPRAPWTVESLAARVSVLRSAFSVRFKSLAGETPKEHVTRWRMQRAAGLLEAGNIPLKEVISASGYASDVAFRAVFRKWLGAASKGLSQAHAYSVITRTAMRRLTTKIATPFAPHDCGSPTDATVGQFFDTA